MFEWIIDAKNAIVDLVFIETELNDINITETERSETSYFDTMAMHSENQDSNTPIGKQVW